MGKLNSRKLGVFVLLVLLNGLNDTLGLGLSPDAIKRITDAGSWYIGAQAAVDALSPVILTLWTKYISKPVPVVPGVPVTIPPIVNNTDPQSMQ